MNILLDDKKKFNILADLIIDYSGFRRQGYIYKKDEETYIFVDPHSQENIVEFFFHPMYMPVYIDNKVSYKLDTPRFEEMTLLLDISVQEQFENWTKQHGTHYYEEAYSYEVFKKDIIKTPNFKDLFAKLDTMMITKQWQEIMSEPERDIIVRYASDEFVNPHKLGKIIDIVEVLRGMEISGYSDLSLGTEKDFPNNIFFLSKGLEPVGDSRERAYVCFYEHGLVFVSGKNSFSLFYPEVLCVSVIRSLHRVIASVRPDTTTHAEDIKNQKARVDSYIIFSEAVMIILDIYFQWLNHNGKTHTLDIS